MKFRLYSENHQKREIRFLNAVITRISVITTYCYSRALLCEYPVRGSSKWWMWAPCGCWGARAPALSVSEMHRDQGACCDCFLPHKADAAVIPSCFTVETPRMHDHTDGFIQYNHCEGVAKGCGTHDRSTTILVSVLSLYYVVRKYWHNV